MAKIIMGLKIDHRHEDATKVQKLLTDNGCYIKTRLGLHKATDDRSVCNEDGLILLEFIMDAEEEVAAMEKALAMLGGVHVEKMVF